MIRSGAIPQRKELFIINMHIFDLQTVLLLCWINYIECEAPPTLSECREF